MPSPFPGMDPYLEYPDFWPEVHNRLIVAIADALVPQVRPKYKVAIEKRIYRTTGNGDNSLLVGIPDVTVKRQGDVADASTEVAVASPPTKPITVTVPMPEEVRQAYLEVRDMTTGEIVTAIEVLSPGNKRGGEGRKVYLQKRQQVLGSFTNLVEIDLLRGGERMPVIEDNIESHYRVLVSPQQLRPRALLYAFNLRDSLPTFSLPLRQEDQEPQLNLSAIFDQVYDRAGYDYQIDYSRDTMPGLSAQEQHWVRELTDAESS